MKVDSYSIATTLNYCRNHADSDEETGLIVWIAEHIASDLQRNHPRGFDYSRFMGCVNGQDHS